MRPGRCVHMAGCLLLRHRRVDTEESAVSHTEPGILADASMSALTEEQLTAVSCS